MDVLENTSSGSSGSSRYDWGWAKGTANSPATSFYRRREGVRRKKPTPLDPTPYTVTMDRMEYPRGTWSYSDQWTPNYGVEGYNHYDTTGFNPWSVSRIDQMPDLTEVAYLYALAKLDHKDLDLGQAVKDAGKTAEMIAELAQVSVESIRAIRKRDVPRLLDALGLRTPRMRGKGVVDAHLTYTWGIRPLLSDIKGAADALTRTPLDGFTVTARSRKHEESSGVDDFIGYGATRQTWTRSSKAQSIITARLKPLTKTQDMMWSLGLDNGLATLWEFAPFSDVVDYVLPIGNFLEGLNALRYYENWQIVNTMINREVVEYSGLSARFSSGKVTSNVSGRLERLRFKRSVGNYPDLPLPSLQMPSVRQMATALSLFAGMASGHTPRYLRVM